MSFPSGSGTSTSTTSNQPPDWQVPYLQDVMQSATDLYKGPTPAQTPISSVARFTPGQNQAQKMLADYWGVNTPMFSEPNLPNIPHPEHSNTSTGGSTIDASGVPLPPPPPPDNPPYNAASVSAPHSYSPQPASTPSVPSAYTASPVPPVYAPAPQQFPAADGSYTADPNAPGQKLLRNVNSASDFGLHAMDLANNPYVSAYAKAATDPIMRNLQTQILPGITSEAVASGNLGSTRQGIAQANSINTADQQMQDAMAQIYSNAYTSGLGTFNNTMNAMPGVLQMNQQPATDIAAIGSQQQDLGQNILNEYNTKYQDAQLAPYKALEQYLAYVGGSFGGSGQGSFTAPRGLLDFLL